MTRAYSNPSRAGQPYALPDVEVFWMDEGEAGTDGCGEEMPAGWYWWTCFPGCMPEGDPMGPFDTEEAALAEAQDCGDYSFDEEG
jgi:hypothetical protein